MKNMTQSERLLEHFKAGMSITRLTSYEFLGIFELSARIVGLEKQGHKILRETVEVTNRFKEVVHVKRYWMES